LSKERFLATYYPTFVWIGKDFFEFESVSKGLHFNFEIQLDYICTGKKFKGTKLGTWKTM